MSEHLDRTIAEKFEGKPDSCLIRRMEAAQDFGYDDEAYELSRRLSLVGKAWKWSDDFYNPRVIVYDNEPEYDFTGHTESDLIDIMLDLDRLNTPEGHAATDEYSKRRAEKINRALSEQAIQSAMRERPDAGNN